VDVVMIDPGTVTVTLERTGQADVVVSPTIDGEPAPGYIADAPKVDPPVVTVAGPESRLRQPISVITERVTLDARTSTVVQDVGVGVADAQLRVLSPHSVRVTVPIVPAPH
jgi:YbbR domain-containing protein